MDGGFAEFVNQVFRHLLFLPQQASTYARRLDALHYFEMASMVALTGLVGLAVLWFCWRYPRRAGRVHRLTPRVVAPLPLEIAVYGSILGFFLLLWVVGFRQFIAFERAPAGALDVYVTGRQWLWQFAYAESGAASAGVLYAPAGRPVRLLLTSRDVIHSFFVPDLRLKRDAVPGLYTSVWFEAPEPGVHRILCAELCGLDHSRMRGELIVLSPERWAAWLAGTRSADTLGGGTDLVALGRDTAVRHGCVSCHNMEGNAAMMRGIAPPWDGLYGAARPLFGGTTVVADEAYLTRSMMDPTVEIVNGFPPVMPSYQGLLEPAEVAALIEFIKSLAVPGDASAEASHER